MEDSYTHEDKMEYIKELEQELKWREETPFYLSKDGMPNLFLLIIGWPFLFIYKIFRIRGLKEEIRRLKNETTD